MATETEIQVIDRIKQVICDLMDKEGSKGRPDKPIEENVFWQLKAYSTVFSAINKEFGLPDDNVMPF